MNALHTQREKRGEKQQQQQWGGREAWCLLDKAYLRDTQWTSEATNKRCTDRSPCLSHSKIRTQVLSLESLLQIELTFFAINYNYASQLFRYI